MLILNFKFNLIIIISNKSPKSNKRSTIFQGFGNGTKNNIPIT